MKTEKPPLQKPLAQISVIWFSAVFIVLVLVSAWGIPAPSASFFKEYAAALLVGILFFWWLWQSRQANFMVFNLTWEKLPLLLLFIYGSLSFLWAENIDFFMNKWLSWFSALLLFWLATYIEPNKKNLIKLAIGLIIAADLLAVIGISQYLFDFPNRYSLPQKISPASTFSNKNIAIQVIVLLFPMTLFLLFNALSKFKTWWLTLSIALILSYLFYTATRAAWVGIFVQVILVAAIFWFNRKSFAWIHWNKDKTIASIAAVIIFLSLINLSAQGFLPAWQVLGEGVASIADSVSSLESVRYKIWQAAIAMITAAPLFGHGLGHFFYNILGGVYMWDGSVTKQVHNDLLETLVELGILGLILLALFIFSMVRIWLGLIRNTKIASHLFYTLIMVALSGSFVNMLFSFPYQKIMPLLVFALFAGLFLSHTITYQHLIKTYKYALTTDKKSVIFTALILIILTTIAIHQNWMNGFGRINFEASKGAQQANIAKVSPTWFYHPEKFLLLNALSYSDLTYKKYHHVLNISQQNLAMFPNNPMTLYQRGMAFIGLKQYEQAFSLAKKIKTYKHSLAYLGLILEIRLSSETNNKKQLLIAYQQFIEHHGFDFSVEDEMAFFYAQQQDFKNAAKHYKNILKNDPEKADKNRVNFLIKQGLLPANSLDNSQ